MSPIVPTMVTALSPAHLRGSYQGVHQMVWGAASFLAPILGSIVIQRFGAPSLWMACLLVGAIAAIVFRALRATAEARTAHVP
jgi:MFS family permease